MVDGRTLSDRLAAVRSRIRAAALRAGRAPNTVRLVLAGKTQPPEAISAAYGAGARDFGENYVQEALKKREQLTDLVEARWHLIGHLQSNKAAIAVRIFDLIQSLDSARLAEKIARLKPAPPMRTLIEVNLAGEASKSGVPPEQVEALIIDVRSKVDVVGLMTIPPLGRDPEAARPYFRSLREMRDRLVRSTGLKLTELSMGMTDDFEVAIEEGATIVRIGRAVFGERLK